MEMNYLQSLVQKQPAIDHVLPQSMLDAIAILNEDSAYREAIKTAEGFQKNIEALNRIYDSPVYKEALKQARFLKDITAVHNKALFENPVLQAALRNVRLLPNHINTSFHAVIDSYKMVEYMKEFTFHHELKHLLLFEQEIDLYPELLDNSENETVLLCEGERIKSLVADVYRDNELIYSIDPRDFEEMIAELMRRQGYQVELTKRTRDGGYDLIALNCIMGQPLKFLVECKRYAKKRPVDIEIARSFLYVVDAQKANKGIIATSSYFSPDVRKEQSVQPYKLGLQDNADIMNWVSNYVNAK